ncbi:MAG TPA: ribose ABC transporter [Chloroflexia bacterium]|nr:ribose ABC transporter [Chloroflexia bacterium]
MKVDEVNIAKRPARQALRPLEVIGQLWAWLFLLVLIVIFSIFGQGFFSLLNFQNIGANMAIVLIMALGQTFVIISGGIDLSTGYVMGLATVVAALVMTNYGEGLPLAVVALMGVVSGSIAGLIAGFINGIIIARLKVPPFIVTLGMYGIARGVGFILSGGQPVSVQIKDMGQIGNGYLVYYHPNTGINFWSLPTGLQGTQLREVTSILPHPLTIMLVLVLICHWVLSQTKFGQHTYAVGGNYEASLRAGIPVVRHTVYVYMLSALLAALAGVLYTFRFTNGAANAGDSLLLDSIAAVVIGGASLFGGEGTIIGTLIGALIIAIIQNGLVILGINPFWQFVAIGVVIILAVLVDQARARVMSNRE